MSHLGRSAPTDRTPLSGLALSSRHIRELASTPSLADDIRSLQPLFLVYGTERFAGGSEANGHEDPGSIAAFLSRRLRGVPQIIAGTFRNDHPYNLARRVLSLDHLTDGHAGVVIGRSGDPTSADPRLWGASGHGQGLPETVDTVRDGLAVLQELWGSWPRESVIGDRRTRQFVRSELIKRIDHASAFRVRGPIQLPSSPQGAPVSGVYIADPADIGLLTSDTDFAIIAKSASAEEVLTDQRTDRAAVYVETLAENIEDLANIVAEAASLPGESNGIVLSIGTGIALADALAVLTERPTRRTHTEPAHPSPAGEATFRGSWGFPEPRDILADAAPAFPRP